MVNRPNHRTIYNHTINTNQTRYYTYLVWMATCFPAAKYFFFFISFVLAFTLANRANSTEVFGIGLMFGINYLYTLFVGRDALNYVQKQRSDWSIWTGMGAISIIAGLAFNFVASILIIIAIVRMNLKNSRPMNLATFGRKRFNEFKRLMMASIVLIGAVATNLYFTPSTLATQVTSLISAIVEPTNRMNLFQLACTIVASGLFFSVIDITDFKLKNDTRLDHFRENFKKMYAMLITLIGILGLRALLAYRMPQFLTMSVGRLFGFDAFFEFAKWSLTIVAIVFWGFSISDFDNLGKPYFNRAHTNEAEDTAEEKRYFHLYHKHKLRPKFIFFMLFTIFLLLSNLANSSYFLELILLIIKVFAPLAVLGITAYTVYLADRITKKSSHLMLNKVVEVKKEVATNDSAGNG